MICYICKEPILISKYESWGCQVDPETKVARYYHFSCEFPDDEETE